MRSIYFLCTTLFFLSAATFTKAQTNVYVPFPDSNAQWNEDQTEEWCNPGFPSQCNDLGYYYKTTHDSIINNLTYHLINFAWRWSEVTTCILNGTYETILDTNDAPDSVGTLIGAIREDSLHRVYYRNFHDSLRQFCWGDGNPFPRDTDFLIYDYGLNIGDSTSVYMYGVPGKSVITGYDSVLIGSSFRKCLVVQTPFTGYFDEWCEGMGSIEYGLLGTQTTPISESGCYGRLDCFLLNDTSAYGYQGGGCDSITTYHYSTGINTPTSQKPSFQIFPNPASDELFLKFSPNFIPKEITIYNSIGQPVYLPFNAAINKSVNIENLSAGLYIIKASDNKNVLTEVFIKE